MTSALWRKSGDVIRDNNDVRAGGALAYFFQANTTTALTTFSDSSLSTPNTHPVVADAYGRMPPVFFTVDGTLYKERVCTSTGSILWEIDGVDPAPISTSGGGGGGITLKNVDLFDVGFIMPMYQTGIRTGWVRCNGKTIGDNASSATERQNDDTLDLFTFLYNNVNDTFCPVSGGRGASAAADFAAHKTIGLPDLRGRLLAGLDDMGASAAGLYSSFIFDTGASTTLGSRGGVSTRTLLQANLPNVTLSLAGLTATTNPSATIFNYTNNAGFGAGGTSAVIPGGVTNPTFTTSIGGTLPLGGSGTTTQIMNPFSMITWYMKVKRETTGGT